MAEQDHEYGRLTDHEYDGIREYDNPCPTWWHLIFLGTFLFGVVYYLFFLGSFGWTLTEAYDTAVAEDLKAQFGEIGDLKPDEKTLVEAMGKSDWLAVGANVFKMQCTSCHGPDGAGLVGPNLTDGKYKNIKELTDIPKVVENGAAAGSMPAWKTRLLSNEIVLVSAYVASLRGKNLAGPGDAIEQRDGNYKEIPPWPTAADLEKEPTQKTEEAEETPPAPAAEPSAGEVPSVGSEPTDVGKTDSAEQSAPKIENEERSTKSSADEKTDELRKNPLRP